MEKCARAAIQQEMGMEHLNKSLQNHKEQNPICRNAIIDFQPLNPKLLIRLNIMSRRRIKPSICFITLQALTNVWWQKI